MVLSVVVVCPAPRAFAQNESSDSKLERIRAVQVVADSVLARFQSQTPGRSGVGVVFLLLPKEAIAHCGELWEGNSPRVDLDSYNAVLSQGSLRDLLTGRSAALVTISGLRSSGKRASVTVETVYGSRRRTIWKYDLEKSGGN